MDKLSEYIPLLIILGTVLFSLIGKVRKSGKITQETTLPGKTAGEFVDERKPPQTLAGSYQKLNREKPKKQAIHKPETGKEKKNVPLFSPEIRNVEFEEEKVDSLFTFDEENITQAIIYSEIINRKEY